MPRRNQPQVKGGTALGRAIARAGPKRTPANNAGSMFRAMERSGRGRQFLQSSGVSASQRTQMGWLSGESKPSAANARAIQSAYANWSASNITRRVGRRIEVYPSVSGADQYGRPVREVAATDEQISAAIDAYNRADDAGLDAIWVEITDEANWDSPKGKAYRIVSHVVITGGEE